MVKSFKRSEKSQLWKRQNSQAENAEKSTVEMIPVDNVTGNIVKTRYRQRVKEVARRHKNFKRLLRPDSKAIITGPCGDKMEIYLKIKDGKIVKITYVTDGCAPLIACGSVLTLLAQGKQIEMAYEITETDIIDALRDMSETHHHCAVLAVITLKQAIDAWTG
ncbi:MAG: iron-sulfur cluster assembly scaffold protein [Candidatus Marinimicrobia bacterium]|nr:iron-sulfur cluster assembly scaffold protein [Candidatus Neomarinimicrobiota bacterium]